MINVIYLTIAFLLVLMNAFFVAAEFGMVRLRHTRLSAIKKQFGLRGKILTEIHHRLDTYLSACQLGITLASLGLGWVGEPVVAQLIEPLFHTLGIQSQEMIVFLSFVIGFTLISFFHIVVGELLPKSLALRQSENTALLTALPLYAFYWLMYPAIWFLNGCASLLLKRTGLDKTEQGEHFYSSDEIKIILNTSHLYGELGKEEAEILEHTMEFADLKVTELMRPQEEMIKLDVNMPIQETLNLAATHRFSRYPVYENDTNNIIGIIHVKDLFSALYENQPVATLKPFIRPVLKISQRLPALILLRQFREGMPHFALIYKNHQTLLGFVTLDNLLHALLGKIRDEFHLTEDDWVVNPDGSLLVRGDCPIFTLERALDLELSFPNQDAEPETLAGAIINELGRLPKQGELVQFKDFQVAVVALKGSKMVKLKITRDSN